MQIKSFIFDNIHYINFITFNICAFSWFALLKLGCVLYTRVSYMLSYMVNTHLPIFINSFLLNKRYQNFIISSEALYNQNGYYSILFITEFYIIDTLRPTMKLHTAIWVSFVRNGSRLLLEKCSALAPLSGWGIKPFEPHSFTYAHSRNHIYIYIYIYMEYIYIYIYIYGCVSVCMWTSVVQKVLCLTQKGEQEPNIFQVATYCHFLQNWLKLLS